MLLQLLLLRDRFNGACYSSSFSNCAAATAEIRAELLTLGSGFHFIVTTFHVVVVVVCGVGGGGCCSGRDLLLPIGLAHKMLLLLYSSHGPALAHTTSTAQQSSFFTLATPK